MPHYFLDSNALVTHVVKCYHREPGTPWIQALCAHWKQVPLYIAQIARVEVIAALQLTGRVNGEQPACINTMVNAFERHAVLSSRSIPVYHMVQTTAAVASLAAALCNEY